MSESPLPRTAFANAQRSTPSSIQADSKTVKLEPLALFFDDHPEPLLVLDGCRQIVFANAAALDFLELDGTEVLGFRIGEILHCRNAVGHRGGCGTTVACRSCGVVNAVLAALGGCSTAIGCRIDGEIGGKKITCVFDERTSPVQWDGKQFVVTLLAEPTKQIA